MRKTKHDICFTHDCDMSCAEFIVLEFDLTLHKTPNRFIIDKDDVSSWHWLVICSTMQTLLGLSYCKENQSNVQKLFAARAHSCRQVRQGEWERAATSRWDGDDSQPQKTKKQKKIAATQTFKIVLTAASHVQHSLQKQQSGEARNGDRETRSVLFSKVDKDHRKPQGKKPVATNQTRKQSPPKTFFFLCWRARQVNRSRLNCKKN